MNIGYPTLKLKSTSIVDELINTENNEWTSISLRKMFQAEEKNDRWHLQSKCVMSFYIACFLLIIIQINELKTAKGREGEREEE